MLGLISHFVFVFVIVIVFVFAFVFVIVILGAPVDSMCHELSEYVWLYGSVKQIWSSTVDLDFWCPRVNGWMGGRRSSKRSSETLITQKYFCCTLISFYVASSKSFTETNLLVRGTGGQKVSFMFYQILHIQGWTLWLIETEQHFTEISFDNSLKSSMVRHRASTGLMQ